MRTNVLLFSVLCLLIAALPASAQTVIIEIEIDRMVCSSLDAELRDGCHGDFDREMTTREYAMRKCSTLFMSDSRNECYGVVRTGFFAMPALDTCMKLFMDGGKIQCLRRIKNGYFQTSAVQACGKMFTDDSKIQCMSLVRNRSFRSYELEICGREFMDSGKLQCLERFGRPVVSRRPEPRPQPVPRAPRIEMCRVQNSSSYVTTVARRDFIDYAQRFAREQRSCVVTNIYGEQRSRTLIGERGRIIRSGMTEAETAGMKRYLSYDRCRILTCQAY